MSDPARTVKPVDWPKWDLYTRNPAGQVGSPTLSALSTFLVRLSTVGRRANVTTERTFIGGGLRLLGVQQLTKATLKRRREEGPTKPTLLADGPACVRLEARLYGPEQHSAEFIASIMLRFPPFRLPFSGADGRRGRSDGVGHVICTGSSAAAPGARRCRRRSEPGQ
jgi:hypothetical protein